MVNRNVQCLSWNRWNQTLSYYEVSKMKHLILRSPLWRLVAVVSVVLSLSACKAYKGTQDANAAGAGGSEGSWLSPMVLSPTKLPHAGSVAGGQSYYKLTGLTANKVYVVSLTQMSAAGLGLNVAVDNHTSGPGQSQAMCYADGGWGGKGGNSCVIPANSVGELYVNVNGLITSGSAGGTFTLNAATSSVSPLTWAASTSSFAGNVGTTLSWYQFNLTSPLLYDSAVYHVNVTGLTDDVEVYMTTVVYGDDPQKIQCSHNAGLTAERCRIYAIPGVNPILTAVGNWTAAGSPFTMTISPPPTLGNPTLGSTVLPVSATGSLSTADPNMDYHVQGLGNAQLVLVNVGGTGANPLKMVANNTNTYDKGITPLGTAQPALGQNGNWMFVSSTASGELFITLSSIYYSPNNSGGGQPPAGAANYTFSVQSTTPAVAHTVANPTLPYTFTATVPADNSPVLFQFNNTTFAALSFTSVVLTPGTSNVDLQVFTTGTAAPCWNCVLGSSSNLGTAVDTVTPAPAVSIPAAGAMPGTLPVLVDTRWATPGDTFTLKLQ